MNLRNICAWGGLAILCHAGLAAASPTTPSLEFGPAVGGFQLAVSLVGPVAKPSTRFYVRNLGKKTVRIAKQYSCSGMSAWWVEGGANPNSLSRTYQYEPEVKGLTTDLRTRCTRNGPIRFLSVAPGKTGEVTVPFASGSPEAGDRHFRGRARLQFADNQPPVELESKIVSRK